MSDSDSEHIDSDSENIDPNPMNEDPGPVIVHAREGDPFLHVAGDGPSYGSYEDCFLYFRLKVVKVGDVWVILPDKAGNPHTWLSAAKFKETFSTYNYSEEDKHGQFVNKPFIGRFMKEGKLNTDRVFREFGMYPDPCACPPYVFNLWTPFAVESITAEGDFVPRIDNLAFVLRHLFILSGRSNVLYGHTLDWISHLFQYPDIKSHMLCFIGAHGCGKSIIFGDTETKLGLLANMMGKSKFFTTAEPEKYVWGNFNSIMKNAYLVNLNEVGNFSHIGHIHKGVGQLKAMIKGKEITINEKGLSHVKSQSLAKYVYTANPKDGANIPTEDSERRYVIMGCSDELCSGTFDGAPVKNYFNKLGELVEQPDLVRDSYDYFKMRSVPKTFHKDDMPVSNIQKQLNAGNRDSIDQWFSSFKWRSGETAKELTNKDLWENYKHWCESESIPLMREQQFKVQLNARPFVTSYRQNGSTRSKKIDREGLERALPPAPEEQNSQDPEPDFKAIATNFFSERLVAEIAADPEAWKAARKEAARKRKQERLAQERVRKQEREEAYYEAMAAEGE